VIYFIKEQREGGLIKIGYVRSEIENRINRMQTGNPAYLILLGVMPGTKRDEHVLRKRFKKARVLIGGRGSDRITLRGEWFEPVDELMELIAGLPPYPSLDLNPPPPRRLRGTSTQS
jgi:hypothetical protein